VEAAVEAAVAAQHSSRQPPCRHPACRRSRFCPQAMRLGQHHRAPLPLPAFPVGAHDDFVDALSGAHNLLVRRGSARMSVHVPRGRIPLASQSRNLGTFDFPSPQELASSLGAAWYPSRS
jgi:hypothetical protein